MAAFSPEQLNFFKFSTVVLDEFPVALRKVFVYLWDTLVAPNEYGGQKWDNSGTVLNLFLSKEGGAAKVPILNKFIDEWDCTALFKATLFAQTFAMSDRSGGVATLHTRYVKPHSLPSGTFHSSVLSPSGDQAETFALALDQLRLLRNTLCHQISTQKIDKTTLDQFLFQAKHAFTALGQNSSRIDSIGNLGEEDFPTARVQQLADELKREKDAAVKFKQIEDHLDQLEYAVKAVGSNVKTGLADVGSDLQEMKTNLADVGSDVQDIKTDLSGVVSDVRDIKRAMEQMKIPAQAVRLPIHIDAEIVPGPDGEITEMVATSQTSQLSLQSPAIPTTSSQQQNIDGSGASLVTAVSNQSVANATQQVLNRIAESYLNSQNLSTPEQFSKFEKYMANVRKLLVVGTDPGSLIITVECGSLQILDELWEDYRTGHFNEMAQKLLVTEDILKEFNLLEVKLTTTILEEEYRACQKYFLQFQELYPKVVETETTSEKETFSTMSTMDEPMDYSVPSVSAQLRERRNSPQTSEITVTLKMEWDVSELGKPIPASYVTKVPKGTVLVDIVNKAAEEEKDGPYNKYESVYYGGIGYYITAMNGTKENAIGQGKSWFILDEQSGDYTPCGVSTYVPGDGSTTIFNFTTYSNHQNEPGSGYCKGISSPGQVPSPLITVTIALDWKVISVGKPIPAPYTTQVTDGTFLVDVMNKAADENTEGPFNKYASTYYGGLGHLITAMNGTEQDPLTNTYWMIYDKKTGILIPLGVDSYQPKDGSVTVFRLEKVASHGTTTD